MERQAVYHTDFPTYESFDTNNGDEATIKKNVQNYLRENKDTYQIGDLFELDNYSEHLNDLIQIVLENGKYYSEGRDSVPIYYPLKYEIIRKNNVKYDTLLDELIDNEVWNPFINAKGEEFRFVDSNRTFKLNTYQHFINIYKMKGLLT
jgi:hypothetical protein